MTESGEPARQDLQVSADPVGDSVSISRESAVNAIFRGGTTAVLALGATYASISLLPSPYNLLVALGTTFVAGVGLVELGRAARHLLRFGSRPPAVALLSAAGFGALALTWAVLTGLETAGLLTVPGALGQLLGAGSAAIGVIFLVSVIWIILQWVLPPRFGGNPKPDEL